MNAHLSFPSTLIKPMQVLADIVLLRIAFNFAAGNKHNYEHEQLSIIPKRHIFIAPLALIELIFDIVILLLGAVHLKFCLNFASIIISFPLN